jgi:hypothetical protein
MSVIGPTSTNATVNKSLLSILCMVIIGLLLVCGVIIYVQKLKVKQFTGEPKVDHPITKSIEAPAITRSDARKIEESKAVVDVSCVKHIRRLVALFVNKNKNLNNTIDEPVRCKLSGTQKAPAIIAYITTVRQNFLAALLENNGMKAKIARAEFEACREEYSDFFAKAEPDYRQSKAMAEATEVGHARSLFMLAAETCRPLVWATIYEDTAKVGLSYERVQEILNQPSEHTDPVIKNFEAKLKKLEEATQAGLLSDIEYLTKFKEIMDSI